MKKFEGILFCTDLDDTLFTDDKKVSKENSDAIEYFKSEGGLFTFITGRVPKTSLEIFKIIKPNAPYGCINGGGIYDGYNDKYLWTQYLDDAALKIVKSVDENLPQMGIQVNTKSQVYFCKDNDAMVYFRKVTGLPYVTADYKDVKEPILKVIFAHGDEKQMLLLIDFLKSHPKADDFDFVRSQRLLYEILPKGVNKGSLLCKMAELFDIDIKRTIAVGDYYNDVSMIRAAGLGFAVENAVSEVKAVADHITANNNDHAIAKIIDGLDKGIFMV